VSEGPIITGKVRLKDETGAALDSINKNVTSSFKDMASVAGGIITAEFSRNVVGAFEEVGRSSIEQAASFESATTRIIAASGATGDEAQKLQKILEDAAKSLGVEFGSGATGAMEALESLVKAGLDPATEATAALEGVLQLATIEGINTASAANMVVQSMTMFGISAEEATRVVDGFVKASAAGIDTAAGYASGLSNVGATAASMGLSMEETLATLVQLDNTYGNATVSGTYLNRMLLDMVAKAEQAELELYNVDGSMKGLDEIVGQLRGTIAGFGDDQEAVNEYLGIFDSRAQKAIAALVGYDGSIAETEASLGDMASAQDQVTMIMDTYEGKMATVKAQQELNNIEIGETTTQLSLMSAEFAASLGPIGNVASALGPSLLSGAMQGLTATYLPMLIGKLVGGGGLTSALGSVGSIIPGIGSLIGAAGPIGLAIVGIGAAIAVFALAWKNNWFGIRDVTKNVTDSIKGTIKGIADAARNAIKKLKELFKWKKKKKGGGEEEGEEKTPPPTGGGETEGPWGGTEEKFVQRGFEGLLKRDTIFQAHRGEYVSVIPRAQAMGGKPKIERPTEEETPPEGGVFPRGPFGYMPGIQWSRYGHWDIFGRWVREDRPGIVRRGGARTYAESTLPSTQAQGGITIYGPLLVVQGNADRRTMEWAVKETFKRLSTVTVESSSSGAPTKRLRTGSIFGGLP